MGRGRSKAGHVFVSESSRRIAAGSRRPRVTTGACYPAETNCAELSSLCHEKWPSGFSLL